MGLQPTIIFDLDGTLVDTAPDLMESLNHTIAADGLSPVTLEDLNHLVGQGARMMIERAYALKNQPLESARMDGLLERFISHYRANMPGKSYVFPGLLAALERLQAHGFTLAVCTNKMEGLARPLLDGLGLTPYFQAITGGDSFAVRKPHGDHILETLKLAKGDPARAIMVGDSINDILAAKNAGIASIAVPFGYSDIAFDALGADRNIRHFDDLTIELIEDLLTDMKKIR